MPRELTEVDTSYSITGSVKRRISVFRVTSDNPTEDPADILAYVWKEVYGTEGWRNPWKQFNSQTPLSDFDVQNTQAEVNREAPGQNDYIWLVRLGFEDNLSAIKSMVFNLDPAPVRDDPNPEDPPPP